MAAVSDGQNQESFILPMLCFPKISVSNKQLLELKLILEARNL